MIPFSRPHLTGLELHNIARTYLATTLGEDGLFSVACEREITIAIGNESKIALTTSIGSAYELMADIVQIGAGDEVVLPTLIHTAAANAFAKRGARLRYYDFVAGGYEPDQYQLVEALSDKTRLVIFTHYLGTLIDHRALCLRLKESGVRTVEDLSHSFLCAIHPSNDPVGRCADFAVASFHDDQWIHCGEGGALLVNASEMQARVDIHRFRGTNKKIHEPRSGPHYDWLATGGEYSANELTAAFLLPQLQQRNVIFDRSRQVFDGYRQAIETYDKKGLIRLADVRRQNDRCAPHAFFIELGNANARSYVVEGMKRVGIDCRPYIQPLHTTTMGTRYQEPGRPLLRAEELAARTMRLPLYADLAYKDQERIIKLLLRLIDNSASNHH